MSRSLALSPHPDTLGAAGGQSPAIVHGAAQFLQGDPMARIDCNHCGAAFDASDAAQPAAMRCPRCGRRVESGSEGRDAPAREQRQAPRARPARVAPLPAFEPIPRGAPRVEAYPSEPSQPKRSAGESGRSGRRGRGAAVAAVFAAALVLGGGATLAIVLGSSGATVSATAGARSDASVTIGAVSADRETQVPSGSGAGGVVLAGGAPSVSPSTSTGASADQTARPGVAGQASGRRAGTASGAPVSRGGIPSTNGATGLAKQIELSPSFNEVVYANSELALGSVEDQRLRVADDEQVEWLVDRFRLKTPDKEFGQIVDDITRVRFLAVQQPWLAANRPSFSLRLSNAPRGTRVRIRIAALNDDARPLLSSEQATAQEWVVLDEAERVGVVWRIEEERDGHSLGYWEVGLRPMWDAARLASLTQPVYLNLELKVTYGDGSEEDTHTARVKMLPKSHVENAYPMCLGYCGLVNGQHPWVEQVLNEINQCALAKRLGANASSGLGSDAREFFGVYLVWRELRARELRYQSIHGGSEGDAQIARSIEDSLLTRNANCVDGAVLISSFLERMGMDCFLIFPKGHALVAFGAGDSVFGLETTGICDELPCPPALRDHYFERMPGLKELADQLAGEDLRDFDNFLASVESASNTIEAEVKRIEEGDPSTGLQSARQLFSVLASEQAPDEDRHKAAFALSYEFMSVVSLRSARSAGVDPVPIPKAFKQELPRQPARTR